MTKPDTSRPKGMLSWLRRRLFPRLAKLCALLGVLILGLWITGRVLTDQYPWSQWIWWMPAIWMIASGWVFLLGSSVLGIFSRRPSGLMLRPVLLLMCIGSTGYLFFGVWHMQRAVFSLAPDPDSIRVMHWNQAGFKADQAALASHAIDLRADVVLIANSQWGNHRRALLESLAPLAPADEKHMVEKGFHVQGQLGHFQIFNDALIASRFPILRSAMVTMGSKQDQKSVFQRGSDFGWVVFIEVDLSERNASNDDAQDTDDTKNTSDSMIIWFVDLPSNPTLWRQRTMQQMAKAIDQWNGNEFVLIDPKPKRPVWGIRKTDHTFPSPDLIIGDFNTPGGSNSIQYLAPRMTDAYQAVGFGRTSSWRPKIKSSLIRLPFKLADWHIDLSLVGDGWVPNRYRVEDASPWGASEHRIQIIDLTEKTLK